MDLCKFQSVQFAHVEGSDILPALVKAEIACLVLHGTTQYFQHNLDSIDFKSHLLRSKEIGIFLNAIKVDVVVLSSNTVCDRCRMHLVRKRFLRQTSIFFVK